MGMGVEAVVVLLAVVVAGAVAVPQRLAEDLLRTLGTGRGLGEVALTVTT